MDGDPTVLVIDGADNCAYDLFRMPAALFAAVFPGEGQDMEFIEDYLLRHPGGIHDDLFARMWG